MSKRGNHDAGFKALFGRQVLQTPFFGVLQMTWHLAERDHAVKESATGG